MQHSEVWHKADTLTIANTFLKNLKIINEFISKTHKEHATLIISLHQTILHSIQFICIFSFFQQIIHIRYSTVVLQNFAFFITTCQISVPIMMASPCLIEFINKTNFGKIIQHFPSLRKLRRRFLLTAQHQLEMNLSFQKYRISIHQ